MQRVHAMIGLAALMGAALVSSPAVAVTAFSPTGNLNVRSGPGFQYPVAMAAQIMRLYDDADPWQRLAENGYQAFQGNFSHAAGAKRILDVVNGLVAR
jgi:hypothetical protein